MPIFEFKCLKCEEFFEILVMNQETDVAMECPKCHSEEFERVLSTTSHVMGNGSTANKAVSAQTRTCSGGSCTTWEVPGPGD
jgi:putative FmdB family regulatory protein